MSVEVLSDGRNFDGVGRVKSGRRHLRGEDLPILPLITTLDGYQVRHFEIDDVEEDDKVLTITFRPFITVCGHSERETKEGGDCWHTSEWNQEAFHDRGGSLELELRPVNRLMGQIEFSGFSYSYKFRSRKYYPHAIHDRATWELDGRATGNTLFMPSVVREPKKEIQNKQDEFSSVSRDGEDIISQFRPFFTELGGMTFQCNGTSLLVTAFEEPFPCRTVIEKPADENYVVHWHQLKGIKSRNGGAIDVPAQEILYAETKENREIDRMNQYDAVRREVSTWHRDALGIAEEKPCPSGSLLSGSLDREEVVERGVEELADAGCKEVVIRDLVYSDSDHGLQLEDDINRIGDMASDLLGSIVEAIHHWGMEAGMVLLPGLEDTTCDSDSQEGLEEFLKELRDDVELDCIYLAGGSREPSLDDRRAYVKKLIKAVELDLQKKFVSVAQKIGFRCGTAGLGCGGINFQQIPYEAIRNREFLYQGLSTDFPYEEVIAVEDDPHDAYFRGYANYLCYRVAFGSHHEGERPEMDKWWDSFLVSVNSAFDAVREHMGKARLLADDAGVLWSDAEEPKAMKVLWAFNSLKWDVGPEADIFDVMSGEPIELNIPDEDTEDPVEFKAEARRVYLVQNALELESY
ncbi:MAG: hypothetical protein ACLFWL_01780 [Candidatus Brocadiia bacterium]